jgi:hypothetical protein
MWHITIGLQILFFQLDLMPRVKFHPLLFPLSSNLNLWECIQKTRSSGELLNSVGCVSTHFKPGRAKRRGFG